MVFSLGSFELPGKQPLNQDLVRAPGLGKWEDYIVVCIELRVVFSTHKVLVWQGKTSEIHS